MAIVYNVVKSSNADVVMSYRVSPDYINPGRLVKLNTDGTVSVAGANDEIIGVAIGSEADRGLQGLLAGEQDVVLHSAGVRCYCPGTFVVGTPAFAAANGTVSNTGVVAVGIFLEPKVAGSDWAIISRL